MSDRDAVRIIAATAEALGHDLNDFIINRMSIRRYPTLFRKELTGNFFAAFKGRDLGVLTVHWDGKLLPD